MGWLVGSKAVGSKAEEPSMLLTIVTKMMDQQAEQQRQMNQLVQSLFQVQSEQNHITKQLLGQYVVSGPNSTSNLDQRLFNQEQDTDWEPLAEDPFKFLGVDE
jgi:hypothetical protein